MSKGLSSMVKKTRSILSNGLPLVVIEIPGSNSLVASLWTKAGARVDPEGKGGLAHFIEHLLIKKTKNYPSDEELAHVLEKVGAFKNGRTQKDWLDINISSSSKDLPLVCKILAEMIFNPFIDHDGFEAEKKVILQEQARKNSLPDDLVWEKWYEIFFNPTPLTRPVIGTRGSMQNINLDDALGFWIKYFKSNNSLLVISGGVKTRAAQEEAEKFFAQVKITDANEFPKYKYEDGERIAVEMKDLPRANMLMSFRTPGGHVSKEFYSLLILKVIMSGGWSSRISRRLRIKESLVYGWGSSLKRYLDTGGLIFSLASAKESFPKMLSVFCEELVSVREKGVQESEVALAKGAIEGALLREVETSWDYTDWYAYDELYWPSYIESVDDRIKNVRLVSKENVERVAKKYLTQNNWHLAIVGDVEEKDIKVDL